MNFLFERRLIWKVTPDQELTLAAVTYPLLSILFWANAQIYFALGAAVLFMSALLALACFYAGTLKRAHVLAVRVLAVGFLTCLAIEEVGSGDVLFALVLILSALVGAWRLQWGDRMVLRNEAVDG